MVLTARIKDGELRILAAGFPVAVDAEALNACACVIVTDITTGAQFVQNAEALRAHLGGSHLAQKSHFAQFRRERDNLPQVKKGR